MDDKPVKKKKPRGKARLIPGKCIACGARCQISCPADAIEMNDKGEPLIDLEKCIGCLKCVKVCPAEALEMVYPAEEEMPLFVREETAKTESEEEGAATNGIEAWERGMGICRTERWQGASRAMGAVRCGQNPCP